ncbi:hypothetical protein CD113_08150 [Staphylococcus simiae]|uniref:Phosphoglucomutase/phosphomannomutase family protein n=1 Tax=Staphylococcus simiae CCM 7213 = CCUG 51256 TaxID=911238 RepID=G5JJ75_9STAP|nr:phosphoglucomutase/phosphomannomutase family protein [Staphylococcus simiae CCM 7213 = CCUG 51256]PNZ11712.1 hypothetical protein CD113_08150 [Staphylococcus simiae]SNV58240.1 phosphoglucomutase/phosphomannomutase [Staphylococcus simiae]
MKDDWINLVNKSLIKDFYEQQNLEEINEGFKTSLKFGTAGIRGKFGLGEGYLNKFTVSKVALGLANFLKFTYESPIAVIHYDIRHLSSEFAKLIADILSNHKVKVYLPDTYKTTPDLSFAVRHLKANAGVMITASHNPKNYNGIKVYSEDGAQLSTESLAMLAQFIDAKVNPLAIDFSEIMTGNKNLIFPLPKEVKENY